MPKFLILLYLFILLLFGDSPALVRGSTWSIVEMDPATGMVGVAAASCVPFAIEALAALVPGRGAAATQANFSLENRNTVFTLLKEGRSAEQIIAAVTAPSNDPQAAQRQYGMVTLEEDGIKAVGFTGERNMAWAGGRQNEAAAVSVQGNILTGEAVVAEALAAFTAPDLGPVALPDRLMRALEAGSAQGGDSRCNRNGIQQTASTAFILVAQPDQPPYAAEQMGQNEFRQPGTPWLYLSVTERPGRANPLLELRHQYDAWRTEHLPPCDTCSLTAIPVPPGGAPPPLPALPPPSESSPPVTRSYLLPLTAVVLLLVALLLFLRLRR
jgi:uncharacterized Ntn-hydrolase superfamily protein